MAGDLRRVTGGTGRVMETVQVCLSGVKERLVFSPASPRLLCEFGWLDVVAIWWELQDTPKVSAYQVVRHLLEAVRATVVPSGVFAQCRGLVSWSIVTDDDEYESVRFSFLFVSFMVVMFCYCIQNGFALVFDK